MAFIRKNKGGVSHLNQIWKKNVNVNFLKKIYISYCIIFEANKYIYRNG